MTFSRSYMSRVDCQSQNGHSNGHLTRGQQKFSKWDDLLWKAYFLTPHCPDTNGSTYNQEVYKIFWLRLVVSYSYSFTVSPHIFPWHKFPSFEIV